MTISFGLAVRITFCVGLASSAAAQAPALPEGCTYLVGAPVGASAAATESRGGDSGVGSPCNIPGGVLVGTGFDGPNSVQMNATPPGTAIANRCTMHSMAWHEFQVAGTGAALQGRATVRGHMNGDVIRGNSLASQTFVVDVLLLELDPYSGYPALIDRQDVLRWEGVTPERILDEDFAVAVDGRFLPGRTYQVALSIAGEFNSQTEHIDFGPPGTGRGVRYDSIEVCLDSPQGGVDPNVALQDLEEKLYRKECLPTVWMPAAQGGRLEDARALLANLTARATATGDPGVNTRVAAQRLAAADADILDGAYQRACRNIADGVRALTTP